MIVTSIENVKKKDTEKSVLFSI